MYKNYTAGGTLSGAEAVSILVLMDLCIKTFDMGEIIYKEIIVSILVLMDLCIKTLLKLFGKFFRLGFNPCFNGSMYKNITHESHKT